MEQKILRKRIYSGYQTSTERTELNESNSLENENIHLFTLDVAKLYPSIRPELAEEALNDLLMNIDEEEENVGKAVKEFVKLSFKESYVTYKNNVFRPKIGIPTGGSLSRQIADVFLHWLLFKKINIPLTTLNELRFWKRFIDDGIGIWRGTKRAFETFLKKLNKETNKYGINFPIEEFQFGKSVNFLDVTLYIDEQNHIRYKSYTKPTDAKRYLRPQSFHPKNVFSSVPMSQMIRTIERNSDKETEKVEMKKLMDNFVRSGYKMDELKKLEDKAHARMDEDETTVTDKRDTITFPLYFFDDINSFKQIIKDSERDLRTVIGDAKIIMAVKKNPSIGNNVVQNKVLTTEQKHLESQKCGGTGCKQCPLVNTNPTVNVNNMIVKPNTTLNCKSSGVIYLWQCQICRDDDSYFGRTIQKTSSFYLLINC